MSTYERTIRLRHDEIAAKKNMRTGEFMEVIKRANNIPDNKELHFTTGKYAKFYNEAMNYILEVFSPIELQVIFKMVSMSSMYSNSLRPLNDNTSVADLSKTFGIHRNNVKRILDKVKSHGVYAVFEVDNAPISFDPNDISTFNKESRQVDYWVLNPFIVFRGKTIDSALVDLFRNTKLTKYVIAKSEQN